MRSVSYLVLYFVLVVLLPACSSIQFLNIETYRPAEITFPNTGTVLIVNNAVPQPSDTGYEYIIFDIKQDTARALADSALFEACYSLGEAIMETGYFGDVLLFHESVRKDKNSLLDERMSLETINALCEETGANAIISIDKLLFEMKKEVSLVFQTQIQGRVDVKINGVMRAYVPNRENALATVLLQDSIYWLEYVHSIEDLDYYIPDPDVALRAAGKYIGAIASPNFVPVWQSESRWYYTGGSADWKRATAYINADKWEQANNIWNGIFENSKREMERARAASNMALHLELKNEFRKAYEWATKAAALFKEKDGETGDDYKRLSLYASTLIERIRDDKRLNIQIDK